MMFVRENRMTNGRISLSYVRSYRDENGKPKQKQLGVIGWLDELEKEFENPKAHFNAIAKQLGEEEIVKLLEFRLNPATRIEDHELGHRNLGYLPFEYIYHELELDTFFKRRENRLDIGYNLNALFRLLVYARLIHPGSKKKAFEQRHIFFENYVQELEQVYRGLDYFDRWNLDMQHWLSQQMKKLYGRSTHKAYYDVTNYYFEIDEEDDLRRRGPSKEYRRSPIVQMGLLLDSRGLPLAFHLFPGNGSEKVHLNSFLQEVQEQEGFERIVVVADKGLNCGDNIAQQIALGNGYIYSQSIRGADAEFKRYVLDPSGYRASKGERNVKSRVYPREIRYTTKDQKKERIRIDQKQVVYYSQKYADKARYERNRTVAKAKRFLKGNQLPEALSNSAASYIKGLQYNEDGELVTPKTLLYLDEEKIREEEKYDGYYAIVSSELDMSDQEIIDTYHQLWKIEETFKISKSELKTRPVYVSVESHITAHFLICFVGLLLLRVLEMKLNDAQKELGSEKRYSSFAILESLREYNCSLITENYYNFHYIDEVIKAIADLYHIDLGKKYRMLGEIKQMIADAKK